jgi:hypothetical protein
VLSRVGTYNCATALRHIHVTRNKCPMITPSPAYQEGLIVRSYSNDWIIGNEAT